MLPRDEFSSNQEAANDPSAVLQRLAPPCNWLFNASSEPVLIVDATTELIAHANPNAAALLRTTCNGLVGTPFTQAFTPSMAARIRRSLEEAHSTGSSELRILRVRGAAIDLRARLSVVRTAPASFLVVRLDPDGCSRSPQAALSAVLQAIDAAPMGFLITAPDFDIDYANRGFLKMVGARREDEVRGTSLVRWLLLTAADLARLQSQRSQRQAVSLITATFLFPARDAGRRVEVCAVPVPDGPDTCWGFTLQGLPRLN